MQACLFAISMLLALVLSGCDQRISQNNLEVVNRLYEKSEKGGRPVSKKEVESVLGQPAKIETFTMTRPAIKEYPGERYIYEQNGKKLVLHFVDGQLSEKATEFGATEPQTPDEAQAPFRRKSASANPAATAVTSEAAPTEKAPN